MSGLHVPLDVEYAADDKIIDAGPMAELLFIRGLAFCKRTMSDGLITDRQLRSVALGIPNPARNAQRLVDVGLWSRVKDGWIVANWLKYNATAADIEAAREIAKDNGIRGNHERWHLDERGELVKPSPKCPMCRTARQTRRPPDRPPDGVPDPNPIGGDVAKEEPEPLKEPEPEELKEPYTSTPSTSLRAANGELGEVIRNLFPRADSA